MTWSNGYGGAPACYFDEELFAGITAGWHSAGTLLLGRRSYEGYERIRVEHPDSPMLAFLDATPTYVVSSTLNNAPRDGVTIIDGNPARIAQLRAEGDGTSWCWAAQRSCGG